MFYHLKTECETMGELVLGVPQLGQKRRHLSFPCKYRQSKTFQAFYGDNMHWNQYACYRIGSTDPGLIACWTSTKQKSIVKVGCTSGGVYVPCIYTYARWDLP